MSIRPFLGVGQLVRTVENIYFNNVHKMYINIKLLTCKTYSLEIERCMYLYLGYLFRTYLGFIFMYI